MRRSWRLTRGPVVVNAKVAKELRSFMRAGGEVVLVPAMGKVVYINPGQVVEPPGRAHLARCPDCTLAGVAVAEGPGELASHHEQRGQRLPAAGERATAIKQRLPAKGR